VKKLQKLIMLAIFCNIFISSIAKAETNIYVILDGSNSMWGQVDGTAKIETALSTLYKSVEDFPADANAGLIAYGHREEKNCQDIQTLLPLSPLTKQSFIQSTKSFTPKGKTPLSASLDYTAKSFKNNDANNNIVLISDGIETCGGDPCETIKRLRNQEGLNVNVHVIGFNVDNKAQMQLKCIADAGDGKYITADSNESFEDAFTQVAQEVQVKEEEFKAKQKPPSTRQVESENVIYETSFDGDFSQEDWTIALEQPMFHSIGDGVLSIAGNKDLQNVFVLNRPLPEGDWQATTKFSFSIQTGEEAFKLGLFQDEENYIFSRLWLSDQNRGDINGDIISNLTGKDAKSGKIKILEKDCHQDIYDEKYERYGDCVDAKAAYKDFFDQNFGELKLVKEGKILKAYVRFEYEFDKDWVSIGEFPLFKPFGQIALSFDSGNRDMSTGSFEHFKFEAINITE
jgi:Ca-activated chloride channel family protein